jgi:hypothetical protein
MKQQQLISSALLAGMLALSGTAAMAQKPDPVRIDGNAAAPQTRAEVRAGAQANNHSPANTLTPAGEPSTMTNDQPNMTPLPVSDTTRAEVRQQVLKTKPHLVGGEKGERPDVPTNPKHETGTPK